MSIPRLLQLIVERLKATTTETVNGLAAATKYGFIIQVRYSLYSTVAVVAVESDRR